MEPIQIIFNGLMVLFALVTILFVIRQHKLEKTKIKIDAYPKRLQIYDAITKYISIVMISSSPNNEILMQFIIETKHAKFLFKEKDEISDYIKKLYDKGLELEYKINDLKQINQHQRIIKDKKERNEIIDKISKLRQWFIKQNEIVDKKFSKYIKIEK